MCVSQGVISELKVVGNAQAAERHCEEEEDDSDAVRTEGDQQLCKHPLGINSKYLFGFLFFTE